jgi:uncharacterized protein
MRVIQIGSAYVDKADIGFGSIKIAELMDGSPIEVPVCIIQGVDEGPCLWIHNGVHGDEYVGAAAIGQLIRDIRPEQLSGSLVLLPMINIQAYRVGERLTPQDGIDMNRIWPGASLKDAMHIFAHSELVLNEIVKNILVNADVVLDVHDGGKMGRMAPYATYFKGANEELEQRSQSIAIASDMEIVWETHSKWVDQKAPGSFKIQMINANIPSITMESGGEGRLDPAYVGRHYKAFINIMKHLGMLLGEVTTNPEQILISQAKWVRATVGGILRTIVKPLDKIEKGQKIASVNDLFGQTRVELTAPIDGWVLGVRTLGTVATGQYVANIGQ